MLIVTLFCNVNESCELTIIQYEQTNELAYTLTN